jgi:hypothetical protein
MVSGVKRRRKKESVVEWMASEKVEDQVVGGVGRVREALS